MASAIYVYIDTDEDGKESVVVSSIEPTEFNADEVAASSYTASIPRLRVSDVFTVTCNVLRNGGANVVAL